MKVRRLVFLLTCIVIFLCHCATVPVEEAPIVEVPLIRVTSVVTSLNEIARLDSDAICPSVSSDGSLVVFEGDSEAYDSEDLNWDIYFVDSLGGGLIKVTEDKEFIWDQNPYWTPDNKIIYVRDYLETFNLWMSPYRGSGETVKLTSEYPHAFFPAVSADGSKIAYTVGGYEYEKSFLNSYNVEPDELYENVEEWYYQGETQPPQIWIIDTQTGSRYLLTEGIHPCFSPDGNKIAFSKLSAGTMEIWSINIDGSHLSRVVSTGGHDIEPCWSPSGRNLAFVSGGSGYWKIWAIKGDEAILVQITAGESNEGHPSWGIGGNLFFHSNSGFDGIFKIWKAKIKF